MSDPDNLGIVHQAVLSQNSDELARALKSGEPVDEIDPEGRTALYYASADNLPVLINLLIDAQANVNARDKNGETALHAAAREYSVQAAKILIAAGSDSNALDNNGNSPLWRAVFESRDRGEIIENLLKAGANPDLENIHGVSPRHLAETIGNYDTARFLK